MEIRGGIIFAAGSAHEPPTGDEAGKNRSVRPIGKLAAYDQPMRRFTLPAMKDYSHPQPGGDNREYTCDEARPYGSTQCVHLQQSARRLRAKNWIVQFFIAEM